MEAARAPERFIPDGRFPLAQHRMYVSDAGQRLPVFRREFVYTHSLCALNASWTAKLRSPDLEVRRKPNTV